MGSRKTFKIDAFPGSAFRYLDRDAIVCIDVMCASTAVVTAVAEGRKAIPVASPAAARALAAHLGDAVVAVEGPERRLEGEIAISPTAVLSAGEPASPLVLAGRWGTELMVNSAGARAVYVACFRNVAATAAHLARNHERVVLLGAGADGDFRCEDQMAAARIGALLLEAGFTTEDPSTASLVQRWSEIDLGIMTWGKSTAELRQQGRGEDVDFILRHEDDLDLVCVYEADAVVSAKRKPELRVRDRRSVPAPAAVLPVSASAPSTGSAPIAVLVAAAARGSEPPTPAP
jgi:phosphosulfolactate phosphohydrolase-like enzyme